MHAELLLEELPEPLFEDNAGNRTERCIAAADFQGLVRQHQVETLRMPPLGWNQDMHQSKVTLDDVQGWQWIGEAVKGSAQHPEQQEVQWGWVSNAVGDTMLIQVHR